MKWKRDGEFIVGLTYFTAAGVSTRRTAWLIYRQGPVWALGAGVAGENRLHTVIGYGRTATALKHLADTVAHSLGHNWVTT